MKISRKALCFVICGSGSSSPFDLRWGLKQPPRICIILNIIGSLVPRDLGIQSQPGKDFVLQEQRSAAHTTMANPHTSPPRSSVWKSVSRRTFEYNATRITSSVRIPGVEVDFKPLPEDTEAIFTVGMEEQLANDLAFIATSVSGPTAIRSVSIQAFQDPKRFTITLASNEKVPERVQTSFNDIRSVIIACAAGGQRSFFFANWFTLSLSTRIPS